MPVFRFGLAFLTAATCTRAADGTYASRIAAVDTIVRAEMEKQKTPGVAVAVIRGSEVLHAKGYGLANLEHGVAVTPQTIFQSGSLAKQFTATAMMLLVEDGTITLNDPVKRFLPDAPPSWDAITIRHLLTHTSGIPDYEDGKLDYRHDYTDKELVHFALGLTLDFSPGTKWKYSNTAYVLLGIIIRRASGKFYGDVLHERVFTPLGMTSARIISEADIVPHRAAGYRLVGGEIKNQDWVSPNLNTTADGSVYASLQDWIAWDRGVRTRAVLSSASWTEMLTPGRLTSGESTSYGFGFFVREVEGRKIYSHSGAWQGFKTCYQYDEGESLSVIVLMNLAQAHPEPLVKGIVAAMRGSAPPKESSL